MAISAFSTLPFTKLLKKFSRNMGKFLRKDSCKDVISRKCCTSSSNVFFIRKSISIISSAFTGFKIYSIILSLIACFAYSKSSNPEKMTTFTDGLVFCKCSAKSSPFIYGIRISVKTTSGSNCSIFSMASNPFSASPTT